MIRLSVAVSCTSYRCRVVCEVCHQQIASHRIIAIHSCSLCFAPPMDNQTFLSPGQVVAPKHQTEVEGKHFTLDRLAFRDLCVNHAVNSWHLSSLGYRRGMHSRDLHRQPMTGYLKSIIMKSSRYIFTTQSIRIILAKMATTTADVEWSICASLFDGLIC